jgi:MYXO-CTERM domain-containing protein
VACAPAGEPPVQSGIDPRLESDQIYGTPAEGARGTFAATGFNAFIMHAAQSFGAADYLWKGDGVTRDIHYKGTLIATPHEPNKCHCVGATFQVYMTAFEAWDKQYGGGSGDLRGLTATQVEELKKLWYVVTSDESGSQAALVNHNLGVKVSKDEARQGDPVQIWRQDGSGHSVIFDRWERQGSTIAGITYFSCQSSGAGFRTETIGTGDKQVVADRIYIVHPRPPVDPPPDAASTTDGGGTHTDTLNSGGDLPVRNDSMVTGRPKEGCSCVVAAASSPRTPILALFLLVLFLYARRH